MAGGGGSLSREICKGEGFGGAGGSEERERCDGALVGLGFNVRLVSWDALLLDSMYCME